VVGLASDSFLYLSIPQLFVPNIILGPRDIAGNYTKSLNLPAL
jgi:hypothetical protein